MKALLKFLTIQISFIILSIIIYSFQIKKALPVKKTQRC